MQIPSLHRWTYHDDPAADGGYTFTCGADAIKSMYQRISLEVLVVPPTKVLAKRYRYIDSTIQGLVPGNPEMTEPLSSIDTSGLIWFVWDQPHAKVHVCFFDGSCFGRSIVPTRIDTTSRDPLVLDSVIEDQLSIDLVRKRHSFKHFSVYYPLTDDPQVNRTSMQGLIASYVQWTSSPDEDSIARSISLDTLQHRAVASVDGWLDEHLRTLWKSPREAGAAAAGVCLLAMTVGMIWSNRSVWKNWIGSIACAWMLRYSHKLEFKKRLPFGWRQFYGYLRDGAYHDFGLYYEYVMHPHLRLHKRIRDREQRSQNALEQFELIFELNRQLLRVTCGGGIVPMHIRRLYNRQSDLDLGIFNRLDIARRMHSMLKDQRTYIRSGSASAHVEIDERLLWERVAQLESSAIRESIKTEFSDLIRRAERERKRSKRQYLLEKAIQIATATDSPNPTRVEEIADRLSISTHSANNGPQQIEDLPTLLGIRHLLSADIDAQHAEWIIICLARPTSSTPMVNEAYTQGENLRKDVDRKIKGFDSVAYETALQWLKKNGVVYRFKPSRHEKYYSLNPHPTQATPAGKPIVLYVLRFLYQARTGWQKVS